MTKILNLLTEDKILSLALKYILENNQGKNNPYHNNHHLLGVFKSSMKLFDSTIGYNLTKTDRTEIGLASLFHDFNHSGGKLTDHENIKLAVNGLADFHINNFTLFFDKSINIINCYNLIEITEYPHKKEPKTIQQKIIRDADMLQCYNKDWFLNVIIGFLNNEIGLSIKDSIENQIKFIKNVKFYTNDALYIHNNTDFMIINELNNLSKIF